MSERHDETLVVEQSPDFLDELSDYLDVLGSSVRLKILRSLEKKPKDIRELSREIETSYENTKKHIDKLLRIGILKKEAGMSMETSKGVHPVWKYSLIPGGLETVIRNLSLITENNLYVTTSGIQERIERIRDLVSGELESDLPVLVVLGGPDDGAIYTLSAKVTDIGREDLAHEAAGGSEIVLPEYYGAVTRISSPHARISLNNGWYIEDCGSKGGTYLNNNKLAVMTRYELNNKDLIELGKGLKGARFVFYLNKKTKDRSAE
jgi:pSer/pThr/pTyr-binding forkhead associated (FHA) protein